MQEHAHSSPLSSSPLSSNPLTSNPVGLASSVLSELGWKDPRPAIMVAEQVDNELAVSFKHAHAAYERTPNAITKKQVLKRLNDLEERLEEERDIAEIRQKEAEASLAETERLASTSTGLSYTIRNVTLMLNRTVERGLQAVGVPDNVTYYADIAKRCRADLATLSEYREALIAEPAEEAVVADAAETQSLDEVAAEADFPEAVSSAASHQHNTRRTFFQAPQPVTTSQFCYPAGHCSAYTLCFGSGYPAVYVYGESSGAHAGSALVGVGDVNGNGTRSFVWGAPGANAGHATLLLGAKQARPWSPASYSSYALNLDKLKPARLAVTFFGENPGDQFGCGVARVGDMDGDGLSETLVAACNASMPGAPSVGAAYLIWGSKVFGKVNSSSAYQISYMIGNGTAMAVHGANPNDHLGGTNSSSNTLSRSGDITGDGLSELILPASHEVDVLFGDRDRSAWSLSLTNISTYMDGSRGVRFVVGANETIISASWIGDINGDIRGDFAIAMQGKVCVVFGAAPGAWAAGSFNLSTFLDGIQGFCITFSSSSNPMQVTGGGDNNGDGVDDFLVAGPSSSAYLFFGSRAPNAWGAPILSADTLTDGVRGVRLDTTAPVVSVSNDGDIDGDGRDEVVLGMPDAQGNFVSSGVVHVLLGSDEPVDWMSGVINMTAVLDGMRGFSVSGEPNEHVGNAVDVADIDGDGNGDLLTGIPRINQGKVHVTHGVSRQDIRFTVNNLRFGPGQNAVVDASILAAESRTAPSSEILFYASTSNGAYFSGADLASTTYQYKFYQYRISDPYRDSDVRFVNPAQTPPQVHMFASTIPLIQFFSGTYVDFASTPVVTANAVEISLGYSTILQSTNLAASSRYDVPDDIHLQFGDIGGAQLNEVDADNQVVRANITECTQRDIREERIQVVQVGDSRPYYSVVASDSRTFSSKQFAAVQLYIVPKVTLNPMIFDQDQPTVLSGRNISALDSGTFFDENTVFEVENATGGYFSFRANREIPIESFSQLPLMTGNIQFVQKGKQAPGFLIRALNWDGTPSPWLAAPISFNHRPVVERNASDVSVVEGQSFDFESDANFTDPDGDPLEYTAQLVGGAPLPEGVEFHPPRQFTGTLSGFPFLQIEQQARDPRGVMTSATFILSVHAVAAAKAGFNWSAFIQTTSTVVGILTTLVGWFIYRSCAAQTRRKYDRLTYYLRKIANLEYHDFDHGGGDIYKMKMEGFVEHLNKYHEGFYNKLNESEEASFAMCLAGILKQRKLIRPSGPFSSTWGWIRCYTEGRSNEIDLKQFFKQKAEIAVQAVAAWQAQPNPTAFWVYAPRRSRVDKLKAFCCATPAHKATLDRLGKEVEMTETVTSDTRQQEQRSPGETGLFGREQRRKQSREQEQQNRKAAKRTTLVIHDPSDELETQGPSDLSSKSSMGSGHTDCPNPPSPLSMNRAQSAM